MRAIDALRRPLAWADARMHSPHGGANDPGLDRSVWPGHYGAAPGSYTGGAAERGRRPRGVGFFAVTPW